MAVGRDDFKEIDDFKKSKRGSVKNAGRLAAFAQGVKDGSAGWETCHSEAMLGVVVAITKLGGAVTFGLSRNGGAHSVTLLLDDNRKTMWFNGDADLTAELGGIQDTLDDLSD